MFACACFADVGLDDESDPASTGGASTSDTEVDPDPTCEDGSAGCPCGPGSSCAAGLDCNGGVCLDPQCLEGTADCPCFPNATCNAGLECGTLGVCKPPMDDSGSGTQGGTTGGESECLPGVPQGWAGPYAVATGETDVPPQCPDPFGTPAGSAQSGLVAPAAECSCTCDDVTASSCDLDFELYSGTGNGDNCNGGTLIASGTRNTATSCNVAANEPATCIRFLNTTANDASCAPISTETVEPSAWTTSVALCEAAALPCGIDGLELPEVSEEFDLGLCIHADGDVECPAEGYTEKAPLQYSGVQDTRACSDCSCGQPQDVECGGRVSLGTTTSCSGPAWNNIAPPQDESINLSQVRINYSFFGGHGTVMTGSCGPSGGRPTGDAMPTDPITLCCLP